VLTALLVTIVLIGPAMAQDEGAPEGRRVRAQGSGPDGEDAGTEIHPDAVSSYVVRTYRIKARKLWPELLRILEESGYSPEEVDDKARVVKTTFIDFEATDYSEETGEPAPRVSPDYPIIQMRSVKVGKVSIEARISRDEKGTVLAMRARILVQGLERVDRNLILTDRRSSGVIEADFLRVLEDSLKLERL
jgi:hypothetical protein